MLWSSNLRPVFLQAWFKLHRSAIAIVIAKKRIGKKFLNLDLSGVTLISPPGSYNQETLPNNRPSFYCKKNRYIFSLPYPDTPISILSLLYCIFSTIVALDPVLKFFVHQSPPPDFVCQYPTQGFLDTGFKGFSGGISKA